MKKRMVALLLCAAVVGSMAGCSKKAGGNGTESTQAVQETKKSSVKSGDIKIDYAKQVTKLADYSGVEVTVPTSFEVNEKNENIFLTRLLTNLSLEAYKEVKDHNKVEENDIVKVDYSGIKDGKAFDGGTAENQFIDVTGNKSADGSNGFIEGFTDALKGAKVGSEVEGKVTFPKEYGNKDLAGQEVTFKFKIHAVVKPVTLKDIDDKFVEKNMKKQIQLSTKKDLTKAIDAQLESQLYSQKTEQIKSYLLQNSTINIPEEYLQARLDEYVEIFEKEQTTDTQTAEDYYKQVGKTREEAIESMKQTLKSQIEQEFLFAYIAEKENIKVEKDEYSKFLDYVKSSNTEAFKSDDDVYNYYGNNDVNQGKIYLENQYLCNKAIDFTVNKAKVTFKDEASKAQQ